MLGRRELLRIAGAATLGIVLTVVAGPHPPHLGPVTGDADLARRARAVLGDVGHGQVAVAFVSGGRATYAGFGADERTAFEIGSIAKAMTGMVLADLAARGAVRLDQPVGELVPGTPLAGARATLAELSRHRSGLPRIPVTRGFLARGLIAQYAGTDPYTGGPDDVLAVAARAGAPGGGKPSYSNLGGATLDNALARHGGTTYAELLERTLLRPVGMRRTTVVTHEAGLPADRARGKDARNGRHQDPWIAAGWAPAGSGVWSTAEDLARLATGILAGTAPGAAAADPAADYRDGMRIGLGWITREVGGRTVT